MHRRTSHARHTRRRTGAAHAEGFDLLLLFVQNRNIALFRETIYERVWGTEFTGDSRTVDLHVQRLRRKLGWQGKLLTIYKTGYRLEVMD